MQQLIVCVTKTTCRTHQTFFPHEKWGLMGQDYFEFGISTNENQERLHCNFDDVNNSFLIS